MTPLDQLADSLHHHENEHAFCIGDRFYSYSDFRNTVAGIQQLILDCGIKGHCNIGILANDDVESYAAVLAVLFLGHAFVPLNPLHPDERNKEIIQQADIRLILSCKDERSLLPFISEKTRLIITGGPESKGELIRVPLSANQHAYILFTSGSTGIPKGVPVTIGNLNSFLVAFFAMGYKVDHRDRFLQMFDLTFDLSIMGYMVPLCIGACVYAVPPASIKYIEVLKISEKHEITFALLVPSILIGLKPFFEEISLPKMKYSLFCGEALTEDIVNDWAECVPNATIQNVYGPTEATIFCMAYTLLRNGNNKSHNGILSIGRTMINTEAMIADENLQPLPSNQKGELCLAGDQVSHGYWKNESINKDAFFNYDGHRYYRTGDLCFIDDEGDFFFIGRIDHQVKINGYRVELSEIEHHAREFLKNHDAVAVATRMEDGTAKIIMVAENFKESFERLNDYLKTKIPNYMIPSSYFSIEKFPLNSNGKVDRKALIKMFS